MHGDRLVDQHPQTDLPSIAKVSTKLWSPTAAVSRKPLRGSGLVRDCWHATWNAARLTDYLHHISLSAYRRVHHARGPNHLTQKEKPTGTL
jgi:hypothetical protein